MAVERGTRGGGPGRRRRREQTVPDGRLPVTEFLFDRPGAASPFGDDQTFPLPVTALAYRHPTP